MRNSIATYKESLSRIASEVLDSEDELEIPQSRGGGGGDERSPPSSSSNHRVWRRSGRFTPSLAAESPVANGTNHGLQDEFAKYEADIKRLQASEAEIKALSFNYAAMLKEKEEQLSKLREENVSLRKNLEAKNTNGHASRDENLRKSPNSSNVLKGTSRFTGNHARMGNGSKLDGYSNGEMPSSQVNEKESTNSHEENRSFAAAQISLESEIKELRAQLESERENSTIIKQRLQEECLLNESSRKELHNLKMDKERTSMEVKEIHKELNEKIADLRQLQAELNRRDSDAKSNESLESLKNLTRILEEENAKLKMEKDELEANLKLCRKSTFEKTEADNSDSWNQKSSDLHEVTEKMALSIKNLEETLNYTSKERDKALQELARLKQHLLEKELEDSEKMDEDSTIIEDLRANCELQRTHILQLEKALKQETAKKEEIKNLKSDELNKSNEIINDLRQKLAKCMTTIDSKNVELLNFQTALGQYYAESEAKEQLGRDLAVAREESAKLSESLKVASQEMKLLKKEKEEIAAKLSQAERMLSEGNRSMLKLEEENSKLRRALEQSMTRLNRMSLDSDNYVDRRIVIKLLVTYFQRNHSREVLDLMVRMLGFSEEDKQRIGFAQNTAGKGVVRGVLGLPGRLVGGILRGSLPGTSSQIPSDNQSFADLWVDFLLKETEERERKEAEERERRETSNATRASPSEEEASRSSTRVPPTPANGTNFASSTRASGFPAVHSLANQISSPLPSRLNQVIETSDAEFATVPLTSSGYPSDGSFPRFPPRY